MSELRLYETLDAVAAALRSLPGARLTGVVEMYADLIDRLASDGSARHDAQHWLRDKGWR
jgi:hypothetical protein